MYKHAWGYVVNQYAICGVEGDSDWLLVFLMLLELGESEASTAEKVKPLSLFLFTKR